MVQIFAFQSRHLHFLWSDFVYLFILQQCYMIAALEEHASLSSEGPEKTDVVKETARYLQACHLIFEKGILSHVFIRPNESAVLKNIQRDGNILKNGQRSTTTQVCRHKNISCFPSKGTINTGIILRNNKKIKNQTIGSLQLAIITVKNEAQSA